MSRQPWEAFEPVYLRSWMRKATFSGRFDNLAEISEFVVGAAKEAGLNSSAVYAVELAVDEACTNIIEHAYGGEGKGDIQCCCDISKDSLTITLRDRGRPFDPNKVPVPKSKANLKNLKSGGAGLYLMRKMMDEVRFEFTKESGNILTLVKCKVSKSCVPD